MLIVLGILSVAFKKQPIVNMRSTPSIDTIYIYNNPPYSVGKITQIPSLDTGTNAFIIFSYDWFCTNMHTLDSLKCPAYYVQTTASPVSIITNSSAITTYINKSITPSAVLDSLSVYGQPFLSNHTIYILLKQSNELYIYKKTSANYISRKPTD
jgi:hypothetical protein